MRTRFTIKIIFLISWIFVCKTATADMYTEDYEALPPQWMLDKKAEGNAWIFLRESPNGLRYDYYIDRAFRKFAPYPVTIIEHGDEGFVWEFNDPEDPYCTANPTRYLYNSYGAGEEVHTGNIGEGQDFVLGINFTNGSTKVYGADFAPPDPGPWPPTGEFASSLVEMVGLLNGVEQWSAVVDITQYGALHHLETAPDSAWVDRIEIRRDLCREPYWQQFPWGWYTMDNLSYEGPTEPFGEYQWTYVPAPSALILGSIGLGLAGWLTRRRRL